MTDDLAHGFFLYFALHLKYFLRKQDIWGREELYFFFVLHRNFATGGLRFWWFCIPGKILVRNAAHSIKKVGHPWFSQNSSRNNPIRGGLYPVAEPVFGD